MRHVTATASAAAIAAALTLTGCGASTQTLSTDVASEVAASEPTVSQPTGRATYLPDGFARGAVPAEAAEPNVDVVRYYTEAEDDPTFLMIRTYKLTDGREPPRSPNERDITIRDGTPATLGMTAPEEPSSGLVIVGWLEAEDTYVAVLSAGEVDPAELRKVADGVIVEGAK